MDIRWGSSGGDHATAAAATLRDDTALTAKLRQIDGTGADVLAIVNEFLQPLRDRLEADFKDASAAAEEAAAKQPAAPEEGAAAAASAPTSESALRKKAEALDVELRVQIFAAAAVEGQTTLPVMPVRSGQQLSSYAAALAVAPGFTRSSAVGSRGGQCCLRLIIIQGSRSQGKTTTPAVEATEDRPVEKLGISVLDEIASGEELLDRIHGQVGNSQPAVQEVIQGLLSPMVAQFVRPDLVPRVMENLCNHDADILANLLVDSGSLEDVCLLLVPGYP